MVDLAPLPSYIPYLNLLKSHSATHDAGILQQFLYSRLHCTCSKLILLSTLGSALDWQAEHNDKGNKSKGNGKAPTDFDVQTNQYGEENDEGEEEFENNDSWDTPVALHEDEERKRKGNDKGKGKEDEERKRKGNDGFATPAVKRSSNLLFSGQSSSKT